MATFWEQYWYVVLFYIAVVVVLYVTRKRFEWQGIVGLLKTNWGVAWMQRYGEKHHRLVAVLGYIGVFAGFLGMILIVGMIIFGVYQLIVNPSAPPIISPVLPGVKVPGSPIQFPLFQTLVGLFIVIVVHEAAHGLVAAAHKIKVKTSGLLVFGPIFGAFVEPDEKVVSKKKDLVQHSIFAAGPFSNMLLAVVFFALSFLFVTALAPVYDAQGFTVSNTVEGSPAEVAGLPIDTRFVELDGAEVEGVSDLLVGLQGKGPGDTLTLIDETGAEYSVTLAESPDNAEQGWIGIEGIETSFALQENNPWLYAVLFWIQGLLYWTFVLSIGLGLANLLPLGPVDGGRMYQLVLRKVFGKKRGDWLWAKTSMGLLVIIIILLVVPIARDVLGRLM